MNILNQIAQHKKIEIQEKNSLYPIKLLEQSIYYNSPTLSLSTYVKRPDKSGIIAEFKRKSPSKPNINLYANIEEVSMGYMQAGASALSILTDEFFFGGRNEDLITARKFNFCPVLRKDFIVDSYQIYEARSIGADAILLITEILTKEQVREFTEIAHALNMEVLLELHSEKQIDKICENVDLIGINNRDLTTFETNIHTSIDLISKLPKGKTYISESGIHSINQFLDLKNAGFDGFLIGEQFMKSAHPQDQCFQFIQNINADEN